MNLNPLRTPPQSVPRVPRQFLEAQAQFGIYLLKALIPGQSNSSLVLSPISLSSVLSQLHLGAGGQTAVELSKIFGDGIFSLNKFLFCQFKNYFCFSSNTSTNWPIFWIAFNGMEKFKYRNGARSSQQNIFKTGIFCFVRLSSI